MHMTILLFFFEIKVHNVAQASSFTHTPTSYHSHSLTHSTLNYAALDHQAFTYNTLSSPHCPSHVHTGTTDSSYNTHTNTHSEPQL